MVVQGVNIFQKLNESQAFLNESSLWIQVECDYSNHIYSNRESWDFFCFSIDLHNLFLFNKKEQLLIVK